MQLGATCAALYEPRLRDRSAQHVTAAYDRHPEPRDVIWEVLHAVPSSPATCVYLTCGAWQTGAGVNIDKANRDRQMAGFASMEEEAALAATAKAAIAEEETCYQVT